MRKSPRIRIRLVQGTIHILRNQFGWVGVISQIIMLCTKIIWFSSEGWLQGWMDGWSPKRSSYWLRNIWMIHGIHMPITPYTPHGTLIQSCSYFQKLEEDIQLLIICFIRDLHITPLIPAITTALLIYTVLWNIS